MRRSTWCSLRERQPFEKVIRKEMGLKVLWRTSPLILTSLLETNKLSIHDLGIKQAGRVLRYLIDVFKYGMKKVGSGRSCFDVLRREIITGTFVSGAPLLQLMLVNTLAKAKMAYAVSVLTAFERSLYLHLLVLLSGDVSETKLCIDGTMVNSKMAVVAVQFI